VVPKERALEREEARDGRLDGPRPARHGQESAQGRHTGVRSLENDVLPHERDESRERREGGG
jgi:hypothetical protein